MAYCRCRHLDAVVSLSSKEWGVDLVCMLKKKLRFFFRRTMILYLSFLNIVDQTTILGFMVQCLLYDL